MMKTLFFLFGLLVVTFTKAQNVNIPDANFKAYLVSNPSINTNGDAEIQVSEATAFTGTINCNSQNISNLMGIEAFVNITNLGCSDNNLTSLNLSHNTALVHLSCDNNQLTSLVMGNHPALTDILCNYNQLTSLDLSGCPVLDFFEISHNQLTSLDVSHNAALTSITCDHNQLTGLDTSQNTILRNLYCHNNQLRSLDMSHNAALVGLYCPNNLLTVLDLSQNTHLQFLDCYNNQLTFLNVKNGNNLNIGGGAGFPAFFVYNNPNLFCIQVDDPVWSENTWRNGGHIDSWANFSGNCAVLSPAKFVTLWVPSMNNYPAYNSTAPFPSGSTQAWIPFQNYSSTQSYAGYWEESDVPSHNGTFVIQPQTEQTLVDFGTPQGTGTYNVSIVNELFVVNSGIAGFSFYDAYHNFNGLERGDSNKIVYVTWSWDSAFSPSPYMFMNCRELNISAAPDLTYYPDSQYDLSYMFLNAGFGGFDGWDWDTSRVVNMAGMFRGSFNSITNISGWDTSHVTNMSQMFQKVPGSPLHFNEPIGNWNTSGVTDMSEMFSGADSFNQPIGNWNTANVTNMSRMFASAGSFNQPIGNWNTSNVTDMSYMFYNSAFDQDISGWDVSHVTNMDGMFDGSAYSGPGFKNAGHSDIAASSSAGWDLSSLVSAKDIFKGSQLSCKAYDNILVSWAANIHTPNNIDLGDVSSLTYSSPAAVSARNVLISKGWTISGDHYDGACNITLATDETNPKNILVFPNPIKDKIYFKTPENILNVKIYDISGKLVKTAAVKNNTMDAEDLPKGNYILEILGSKTKSRIKIIKN